MSTYAIGDVQGCYEELARLLEQLCFDPAADRLLFAGDLVNRGPASLDVLRLVHSPGEAAVTVLGNHDVHLLAIAWGVKPRRVKDTLAALLDDPDSAVLLDWLRRRPLAYRHDDPPCLLVHAGLPPQWDAAQAERLAAEVQRALGADDPTALLRNLYGDQPDCWHEDLQGWDRLRFVTNCLTRLRFCDREGRIALAHSGPPDTQPPPLLPWYAVPGRRSADVAIVFGHWSTLRLSPRDCEHYRVYPLDTGCVWGGALTARRLEDGAHIEVPARRPYA